MYLIGLMSQLKIVLIITNCTRFIQCSTWYEKAFLKAISLDKIKQLMKAWLPLGADFVMCNIFLLNQSREELRYGCAVMLIQHICINLRCILVDRKTLELGLGYDMVMKLCKDMLGKNHHVLWQPVYNCSVTEGLAGS